MADGETTALVVSAPAPTTPMELLSRALERGADLTVLEKLMDLQERHERNQARKAFDDAMASARGEFPIIRKNRTVDFTSPKGRTNYQHEDLAEIAKAVGPVLAKYGLSYRFRTTSDVNQPITVTCIISHRLGYSEENTLVGPRDESGNKNAIQAIGSTLTYLQRMTLKAALGLAASDDDDGQTSGGSDVITDEQAAKLRDKIDDTGADVERFCKYWRIEALPDLPRRDFDNAMASLDEAAKARRSKPAGGK